jgi:hypothetical protein
MRAKLVIILALIAVLTGTGTLFALMKTRVIKPVTSLDDVVLTRSLYDAVALDDITTQRFTFMAYIAGFLDALQLEEVNEAEIKQFLSDCEGMTLGQLAEMMLKFYKENPELKNTKPADFLTSIVPKLRKGLPAVPAEQK